MGLLDRIEQTKAPKQGEVDSKKGDPIRELKKTVQNRLVEDMDPQVMKMEDQEKKDEILRTMVQQLLQECSEEAGIQVPTSNFRRMAEEIMDEITGFGPIQSLINEDTVSEIMVNGPKQVYAERKGKLALTDTHFRDNEHVMQVIEKIIAPIGRRCDESSPMVDARLPDGSRVNAIIPPLALNGPTITIRKFKKDAVTIENLIQWGSVTREMADFLRACVQVRLNIVVSGGTGSGKTTTLNVLSSFIPNDERIITVEDAAELQLRQDHVVRLETRPPNIEGKGEISIRDLIKNTLRMRPERVVVGECRGGEALDMLQAMNTGHDGSLTTGHANTPRDMIRRLETMVLMAGIDLPVRAIREQIASAVHLIVQQSRLNDGTRKITAVTEVQGMEGDTVVLQDIFVFRQTGIGEKGKVLGNLMPTGIRPKFITKFETEGIFLPPDTFMMKQL